MIALVRRSYHSWFHVSMCAFTIDLQFVSLKSSDLRFLARTKSALGYVSGAKYKASEMRRLVLNEVREKEIRADHRGTNGTRTPDVVATILPCGITRTSSVAVRARVASKVGGRCVRKITQEHATISNKTDCPTLIHIREKVCIHPSSTLFSAFPKRGLGRLASCRKVRCYSSWKEINWQTPVKYLGGEVEPWLRLLGATKSFT